METTRSDLRFAVALRRVRSIVGERPENWFPRRVTDLVEHSPRLDNLIEVVLPLRVSPSEPAPATSAGRDRYEVRRAEPKHVPAMVRLHSGTGDTAALELGLEAASPRCGLRENGSPRADTGRSFSCRPAAFCPGRIVRNARSTSWSRILILAAVLDDARFWAAVITGAAGFAAAVSAVINGVSKYWNELRRARHEEVRWILELQSELEKRLHARRVRTYPEVFRWLQKLSHHSDDTLDSASLETLATELNDIGYSEAALYMLPETRATLFALRDELLELARADDNFTQRLEKMRAGNRTRLTEMLRRDVNHTRSEWGEYRPLLDHIALASEYANGSTPKP